MEKLRVLEAWERKTFCQWKVVIIQWHWLEVKIAFPTPKDPRTTAKTREFSSQLTSYHMSSNNCKKYLFCIVAINLLILLLLFYVFTAPGAQNQPCTNLVTGATDTAAAAALEEWKVRAARAELRAQDMEQKIKDYVAASSGPSGAPQEAGDKSPPVLDAVNTAATAFEFPVYDSFDALVQMHAEWIDKLQIRKGIFWANDFRSFCCVFAIFSTIFYNCVNNHLFLIASITIFSNRVHNHLLQLCQQPPFTIVYKTTVTLVNGIWTKKQLLPCNWNMTKKTVTSNELHLKQTLLPLSMKHSQQSCYPATNDTFKCHF